MTKGPGAGLHVEPVEPGRLQGVQGRSSQPRASEVWVVGRGGLEPCLCRACVVPQTAGGQVQRDACALSSGAGWSRSHFLTMVHPVTANLIQHPLPRGVSSSRSGISGSTSGIVTRVSQ